MKSLLLLISLFNQPRAVLPGDSLPLKHRVYKTKIFTAHAESKYGYLTAMTDSFLTLSGTPHPFGILNTQIGSLNIYAYQDISYVQLKRKGIVGRSMLIGALAGFTTGVLWGFIEGSDPHVAPDQDFFGIGEAFRLTAGEKALGYGTLLALAGTITGAITGAVLKKKFTIGGRKEKFEAMRITVLDKAYGRPVTVTNDNQ